MGHIRYSMRNKTYACPYCATEVNETEKEHTAKDDKSHRQDIKIEGKCNSCGMVQVMIKHVVDRTNSKTERIDDAYEIVPDGYVAVVIDGHINGNVANTKKEFKKAVEHTIANEVKIDYVVGRQKIKLKGNTNKVKNLDDLERIEIENGDIETFKQ